MFPLPEINADAVSRVNAAWLGSEWCNPADRELAERLEELSPGNAQLARKSRQYHRFATRTALSMGAKGVLFASSRLPWEKLHPHVDDLGEILPGRYVFANATTEGVTINAAVLSHPRVSAVMGSARDPEGLMGLPEVKAIGEPLQVQLQWAAHYWPAEFAAGAVADFARLLSPGSSLMLTVACTVPRAPAQGRLVKDILAQYTGPIYDHQPDDVAAWLADAGLKPVDSTVTGADNVLCTGLMAGFISVVP